MVLQADQLTVPVAHHRAVEGGQGRQHRGVEIDHRAAGQDVEQVPARGRVDLGAHPDRLHVEPIFLGNELRQGLERTAQHDEQRHVHDEQCGVRQGDNVPKRLRSYESVGVHAFLFYGLCPTASRIWFRCLNYPAAPIPTIL